MPCNISIINYINRSKGATGDARPSPVSFISMHFLAKISRVGAPIWQILDPPLNLDLTAVQALLLITLNMFSSIFSCALQNLTTVNLQCSVPFHHSVFVASSNVINLRKTKGFQRYPVTFNQSQPPFFIFISLHLFVHHMFVPK